MQTKTQTQTQNISELAAEYRALQEKIADDLERMDEIEETFRELDADTYVTPAALIQVREYKRFNANDAIELMSERSLKQVLSEKVDPRKVKELFPGIYRKAQRRYGNRVSIEAL